MYVATTLTSAASSRLTLFRSLDAVSATWPDSVRALADTYMRSPVRITVGTDKLTANVNVEQGTSISFRLLARMF